jgi:acyl-CoA thioester hydrolase
LGLEQQHLRETTGGMFVVTHTSLRYLLPARLDDVVHVSAQLEDKGRASLSLVQQATRQDGVAPSLLCEGSIRIGWVDAASMRPARIPTYLLDLLP